VKVQVKFPTIFNWTSDVINMLIC